MKRILDRLRGWARRLKRQTMVLWFCYQHPQTPWLPKWISVFVVAYALSPIDLIPDFIPVLGYLDDVIILPLGILLAIRLMPAQVLEDCQHKASEWEKSHVKRPANRFAAVIVVLVWLVAAGILGACFLRA
ncbi:MULTISPECIES: YkvA family protein [unclassified Pseudomonas]|uniref:YkvA family protein n=1 Tax=unclassified Pseudomonas TaxID=196821 RepID=UPI000D3D3881|nr:MULTISPECIES: YkvA family protein [unclassified Pseudomonas]